MKIERLYSNYQEEERLYSTGNDELDELMERAFCDGYEYAQREFARKKGKKNTDYLKEFIEDDIKEHKNAGMPVDSGFLDKLKEPIDNKTKRGDLRNMQDLAIHNARSRDRGNIEFTPERGVKQERLDSDYIKKKHL